MPFRALSLLVALAAPLLAMPPIRYTVRFPAPQTQTFEVEAVFPVAGLGTRFLPATKAIPKELLPIVDRPLIQYAVDEAREAGIEQMIFVTGRGKTAIVEHFDVAYELETTMGERGKDMGVLEPTRATPGDIITVRQQVPMGLGHAIWCARAIVGDEPFAIFLPDELIRTTDACWSEGSDAQPASWRNAVLPPD